MKKCAKCKEVKPFVGFYSAKTYRDGHSSYCRECIKVSSKISSNTPEGRSKKRACDKAYRRRRRSANPEEHLAEILRYNRRFPERVRAVNAVNNALRYGRLMRKVCMICSNEPAQGHHPDYLKPLDVLWLCASCHKLHHMGKVELLKTKNT